MKKLLLLLTVFFTSSSLMADVTSVQQTLVGTEFIVNLDGVDVYFTITDDGDTKTAKVGRKDGDYSNTAVDHSITQKSITIPQTVKYNGINYTVTAIGNSAFYQISALQEVVMPSTIETIEDYAFCNNSDLHVTIPATVTAIEHGAFSWCHTSVFTVESSTPLEIDENVFYGFDDLSRYCFLRVPDGAKEAYLAAPGWNKFPPEYVLEGDEVMEFTEDVTTEGETVSMSFSVTDRNAKTVKVGQLVGSWEKTAVSSDITATSITVPETITHAGVKYTVTAIGDFAFCYIINLQHLTLPSTITSIGNSAFYLIPIQEMTLPTAVTSIGMRAFGNCYNLKNLEIPANVKTIGIDQFHGCTGLESLTVAQGNDYYESPDGCNAIIEKSTHRLVAGTIATKSIPASVVEIGNYAFRNINGLVLTIPTTVRKIGSQALGSCYNAIFSVNYSADELTEIEVAQDAFYDASSITLRVPTGTKNDYLATTGWDAFPPENVFEGNWGIEFTEPIPIDGGSTTDMTFTVTDSENNTVKVGRMTGDWNNTAVSEDINAESISIPATITHDGVEYTVTSIGDYAFNNRQKFLKSISLPNTITSIGNYAFFSSLTTLEIPVNVEDLSPHSLSNCRELSSLTVAEGNMHYEAPDGCNAVIEKATNKIILGTKATKFIPAKATEIGERAFYNIQYLDVVIPTTVRKIGNQAFAQCFNSVITANYLAEELSEIDVDAYAFYNSSSFPVYLRVPAGAKSAYMTATGWKGFSPECIFEGKEGSEFTEDVTTVNGTVSMTFTITCDGDTKTVKVGRLTGNYDKPGIDPNTTLKTITIPEKIIHDGVEYLVTCIGRYAIYQNKDKVKKVEIPASITAIEEQGIELWNLESIDVDSNNAIYESPDGCNAVIEKATHKLIIGTNGTKNIPASVIEIAERAFSCGSSVDVNIPTTVRKIDVDAFPRTSGQPIIRANYNAEELQEIDVSEHAFNNFFILLVPAGTKAAYKKATGWSGIDCIVERGEHVFHVATAGTLTSLISEDEKYGIEEMKLTGELNGTDFRLIRDMAGYNYQGKTTYGKLKALDLSGARIVAGGEMYLDATRIKKTSSGYVAGDFHYSITKSDIFPQYLLHGCDLVSITLPESITQVDYSALASCFNLKSVILPGRSTQIDYRALGNCYSLERVEVASDNIYHTSVDGILFNKDKTTLMIYPRCIQAASYTVPNTVTELDQYAFDGCTNLTSIVLPDGLLKIGIYAFKDCTQLPSVSIPSSVDNLHVTVFEGCTNLSNIIVDDSNDYYSSVDGVLFDKKGETLICYPEGKDAEDYAVPNGVKTIGSNAFHSCNHLRTVTIPNSVTTIEEWTFGNCTSITTVNIPQSVTAIGNFAFYNCKALEAVTSYITDPFAIEHDVFWGPQSSNPALSVNIYATATLYVPFGSKAKYQAAKGWKNFEKIEEMPYDPSTEPENIVFASDAVKAICVANWDTNNDGELNMDEAAAVTDLKTVFKENKEITSFEELRYFSGLKAISNSAFEYCDKLASIVIPKSVTSIGNQAFFGCSAMTSLTIPENVTSIGTQAFNYCGSLTSITVESGNTKYDSRENCNAIIERNTNKLLFGCKNTIIPNSVNYIEEFAFFGCKSLASMTIPSSVSSIGQSAFSDCSGLISMTINDGVTSIGITAFMDCSSLTSITIPNSVVSIGGSAFWRCQGLTSITIPANVSTIGDNIFVGCQNLSEVIVSQDNMKYASEDGVLFNKDKTELICYPEGKQSSSYSIPTSVTEISGFAFQGNTLLSTILCPKNLRSIGNSAFGECTSLETIVIPRRVQSIGSFAFSNCKALLSITSESEAPFDIEDNVFWGNQSSNPQENVDIYSTATLYVPTGTKTLYQSKTGWSNFKNIEEMPYDPSTEPENIVFASNAVKAICVANWDTNNDGELNMDEAAAVTDLGTVFQNNQKITSFDELQYFTGLTSIGRRAFYWCNNLTSIIIPKSVTYIDNGNGRDYAGAFSYCHSLTSIVVEEGNPVYDSRDNCNAIIKTSANELIVGCKTTVIPSTVTRIGNTAFYGSYYLYSITIPEGVTSIGHAAFNECWKLSSVKLPNSLTEIGNDAFHDDSGITSITIPSGVTFIGDKAFFDCNGMISVTSLAAEPIDISESEEVFTAAISIYENATLYVPFGSKAKYQTAEGWKNFVHIEELGLTPMDEQEDIDYGEGGSIDEKTNLEGAIIDNVFYNISAENGGFDADEQCIVVKKAMTDEEIESVFGEELQSSEVKETFAGLVIQVPAGKGSVMINAQTTGGMALKVKIGSADPITLEFSGKMKVSVPYNVTEPTYVYIYAGESAASARAGMRGNDNEQPSLKIYGISVSTNSYKKGDANGDGVVDVADVVAVVNYILGKASDNFNEAAANINGDEVVDVADVVGIVNIILGKSYARGDEAVLDEFTDNDRLRLTKSDRQLTISLDNNGHYVAAQFDVRIPEGQTIESVIINKDRAQGHQAVYAEIRENLYRVVVYTLDSETFAGHSGELLSIRFADAAEGVEIDNIKFVTCNMGIKTFAPLNDETTGMAALGLMQEPADIYSLDGRLVKKSATSLEGLPKGVYIIRGRKVVKP